MCNVYIYVYSPIILFAEFINPLSGNPLDESFLVHDALKTCLTRFE